MPSLRVGKAVAAQDQASVEPLPVHGVVKSILRQTVQILKRHRDVHF